ncbi:MAG: hypothetical protein BJ554DRAFT_4412 [Olpidium bornovanus]|uniref:Uncharacterized protein n=1 Tax=Olpidium bornovanus TaxID=278681 RepID=A0A8H8A0D2_9FUNG|nr:MAG: hypothetical protein BJ554DRAFT_4412 [Olpidium bornovanus]
MGGFSATAKPSGPTRGTSLTLTTVCCARGQPCRQRRWCHLCLRTRVARQRYRLVSEIRAEKSE